MGTFLSIEKRRQAAFKMESLDFSDPARSDGMYQGKPRAFCLPRDCARENLFPEIREAAIAYFADAEIKWHDGQGGNPSNHLCSSMVCGVNFLYPFADKPEALVELLRPIFPAAKRALPIERGQYVAFEWIGAENYLGEKMPGHGQRTRGARCTSADAAVMFENAEGKREVALIEWKYTESYGGTPLHTARSGTDRTAIYRHLYERDDFPLNKALLPSFEALFYEPFYQFLRQQCLAREMERAGEMGADRVTLVHICPAHNSDFQTVTSPELRTLGASVTEVWDRLLRERDRFIHVHTEDLFGRFSTGQYPALRSWWAHLTARYPWVTEAGAASC